jgi:hypothetical protein
LFSVIAVDGAVRRCGPSALDDYLYIRCLFVDGRSGLKESFDCETRVLRVSM